MRPHGIPQSVGPGIESDHLVAIRHRDRIRVGRVLNDVGARRNFHVHRVGEEGAHRITEISLHERVHAPRHHVGQLSGGRHAVRVSKHSAVDRAAGRDAVRLVDDHRDIRAPPVIGAVVEDVDRRYRVTAVEQDDVADVADGLGGRGESNVAANRRSSEGRRQSVHGLDIRSHRDGAGARGQRQILDRDAGLVVGVLHVGRGEQVLQQLVIRRGFVEASANQEKKVGI